MTIYIVFNKDDEVECAFTRQSDAEQALTDLSSGAYIEPTELYESLAEPTWYRDRT